jgi:hypothetical protein
VVDVEADPGVWLQAIAVVPVAEDVPAPAPEPPALSNHVPAGDD